MTVAEILEQRLRERSQGRGPALLAGLVNSVGIAAISREERRIPYWPIERIESLRDRRVRQMIQHAHATVPFYRDLLDRRGISPAAVRTAADLHPFPRLDGTSLASDPMRFVSEPYRQRGREVFKTSGSTSGLRKPIFWDHASLLLRAARGERDRVVMAELAGEPWREVIAREFITNERRHRLVRLLGIDTDHHQRLLILPADFSSRTQRTIYSERSFIPRRPIHYHHLPPSVPFEAAAAHIRAIRPNVVFSFGSYVDQFLHFLAATGTDLPLPRLWVYLGDRISPGARSLAEELGCRLYSVYGAMEAGTIGFQCEHRQGFHLNIDLCDVRIVDDEGEPVPDGVAGNIVITPLDNRAMVLINYWVGDRGVIDSRPCPCGRTLPLLSSMEGRRSELLKLGDGREVTSIAVEAYFSAELRRTLRAQIEQTTPGRLRWRVIPAPGCDEDDLRASLLRRGEIALGRDTRLEIEISETIPLNSSGKFSRVVRRPPDQPSAS